MKYDRNDTERFSLVNNIDSLFPADSDFPDTAEIGKKLLLDAIYANWHSLPLEILRDYSRNCNFEEMAQRRKTI